MARAATAAIALTACGEAPLEPRDPTPGVPHFKVMSFNVEQDSWDDASTVRAIGVGDADIVALQETTPSWESVIREHYADRYPHMLFAAADGARGLAVLSRYPLEDFGVRPGPNGWHPAWHVVVDSPAGRVQVLNVHLRSYFRGRSSKVESYFSVGDDHRYEIEVFSDQCDSSLMNLVVGDFNEDEDGPAVRYLENLGFSNAVPLYHPGQGTWRKPSLAGQLSMALDHILFDESLDSLNAWVENTGRSDHLPVLAHFEPTQNE